MADTKDIVDSLRKPITRVNADVALLCEHAQAAASLIESLRSEHAAALGLVASIRMALGDNGQRMQSELIEWCASLRSELEAAKKDAGRLAWLVSESTYGGLAVCEWFTHTRREPHWSPIPDYLISYVDKAMGRAAIDSEIAKG